MDYKRFFSQDTSAFLPSPTREIFKKVDISSIFSMAGGYPDPSTFPLDIYGKIMQGVINKYGGKAFLYSGTQGVPELLGTLSERYCIPVERLQITTSSQQGIDVCARVLVDPGDVIITSNPTYLGALQSFRSYRADIRGVAHEQEPVAFRRAYSRVLDKVAEEGKKVKMLYMVPDFQNPSGETLTLEERKILAELSELYDFIIVEDCPYTELRYDGDPLPSIYSFAPDRVIHLGSFSKIMSPGFRLGWMIAHPELLRQVYVCKQALDLCAPVFDQYVAAEYMSSGLLDENLEKSRRLYRKKRDIMLEELEKGMPDGVTWTRPEGGMFVFLTFPDGFNAVAFYDKALSSGVGYVAGNMFFTDFMTSTAEGMDSGAGLNTMRLNFSFLPEDKLREGVRLLCRLINETLK